MGSQDGSPLRETRKDPFSAAASECSCRQDGLTVIVTACLTFATGVTVALVMQIYFGDPQVRRVVGGNWGRGSEEKLERAMGTRE
jgi:gamma-glutamyltranspeptidase/glutathione hydrolase